MADTQKTAPAAQATVPAPAGFPAPAEVDATPPVRRRKDNPAVAMLKAQPHDKWLRWTFQTVKAADNAANQLRSAGPDLGDGLKVRTRRAGKDDAGLKTVYALITSK